jgi:tRNA threonylcarbamoyladenosine biosynthesis protein TsaE
VEWPERLSLSLPDAWILDLSYAASGGRIATLQMPSKPADDESPYKT